MLIGVRADIPAPPGAAGSPSRILIVDRQPLFCAALENILGAPPLAAEVRSVPNAEAGLRLLENAAFDLVVAELDCGPPGVRQLAAQLGARVPPVRLLLLGERDGQRRLLDELGFGADGFFSKDDRAGQLVHGVEAVLAGNMALDQAVMSAAIATLHGGDAGGDGPARLRELSATELGILVQVAAGLPVTEIARVRGVTEGVVRHHLGDVYRKLRVRNRTQAMLVAMRAHLPQVEEEAAVRAAAPRRSDAAVH